MACQGIRRATRCVVVAVLLACVAGCDSGGGSDGPVTALQQEAVGNPVVRQAAGASPADLPPPNPGGDFLLGIGTRTLVDPYIADAPLRDAMLHCTVTLREGEECNLEQMPLLGMTVAAPGVDDLMARVLVSHPWMGLRFRQVIEQLPPEMLLLARSLTTVVISYDIRPSFYTPWTGAIYLDPDDLWLTEEERSVIDTAPDYRSGFGSELAFTTLWRYVKDNEYATRPPTTGPRTIEEIRYAIASLLFHELAHANDYFYPGRDLSGVMQVPLYRAVRSPIPSEELAAQFPLRSLILEGLGLVRYHGVTATATQKAYLPGDVAAEFENDYANAFYSYASEREDLAMLFEELMMLYSFGIDRDVGVTGNPGSNSCADYVVTWGERNRILTAAVGNRALFTVARVLPERHDALSTFLADYPAGPVPMVPGVDWCANRFLSAPDSRALTAGTSDEVDVTGDSLVPYR